MINLVHRIVSARSFFRLQFLAYCPLHIFRPVSEHHVYLSFVRLRPSGWVCRFHKGDLQKTPICRPFNFREPTKIYEVAHRGNGMSDGESRRNFDRAIASGRGGIWLHLSNRRYRRLELLQPQR